MAGMSDALAMMFAGSVGNYAENRSQEIGDEVKARLADAREQRMLAIRNKYDTEARKDTQAFQSTERKESQQYDSSERDKDRQLTASEGAANRASTLAAANIRASRADNNDPSSRLQGTPQIEKDPETGEPTGRMIFTYRDGSVEVKAVSDLPGGDVPTTQQRKDKEALADAYAKKRVDEKSGYLSSDKEDFKEFGGSRTKAMEHYKKEYLSGKAEDNTTSDADPSVPNRPAELQEGADMAQADLVAKQKAEAKPPRVAPGETPKASNARYTQQQAAIIARVKQNNPEASESDIVAALKRNPQTAPLFQ